MKLSHVIRMLAIGMALLLAPPVMAQAIGVGAPLPYNPDAIETNDTVEPVAAEDSPTAAPAESAAPAIEGQPVAGTGQDGRPQGYVTFKTPWEIYLTGLSVALLVCALAVLTALAWRSGLTPEFIRAFVIVTVIFAALFLIAAGYSDEQAAPVYGLLGTVLGYLFGKSDAPKEQRNQPAPASPAASDETKGKLG